MKCFHPYALLALLAIPSLAVADLQKIGANASASFTASGPAGLSIEGKTADMSLVEQGGILEFTVRLAGLDTGISLRNKHMREKYLEVQKFPAAVFKVQRSAIKLPAAGTTATSGSTNGQLAIHGVTKSVAVSYKVTRVRAGFDVEGSMRLNIRDFGINVPSYLGVTVKPEIDVMVKLSVADQ